MNLSSLPTELFELGSLETLDMSRNEISSLDKISCFQNLKELIASNNKISSVPESIKELENLETLRLDGNPITVTNPGLASCFGKDVSKELSKYFNKESGSSGGGSFGGGFLDSGLNDVTTL